MIHRTVNLSYLRRYDNDLLPGQTRDAESPDTVIAGEDPTEGEFEVTRIFDARINRQYRGGRLQFQVAWRGWPDDPTWYHANDGEFSHAKHSLSEYYTFPSTKVRRPRATDVTPPSPPTGKPRDKCCFARGGGVTVGYSHSPCSFPCIFVDSYLVLCGPPVQAAIHLSVI